MGLDTTHDAWHGSYSAFMRWRIELARVAGLPPLSLMEGFYGDDDFHSPFALMEMQARQAAPDCSDSLAEIKASLPISWAALKPDPLHVLLFHSDCDGQIEVEDLLPLAERLEQLIPLMKDEDAGGHTGNWCDKTREFADGCRRAAAANEPLEFH